MTHEDIVYDRRVRLLEYAANCGNVTRTLAVTRGGTRTTVRDLADLMPGGFDVVIDARRSTPMRWRPRPTVHASRR